METKNILTYDDTINWLDKNLPLLEVSLPPRKEMIIVCPHCNRQFPYIHPITVRKSDVKLFQELISAAEKVLEKEGLTAYMLAKLSKEINKALGKQIVDNIFKPEGEKP